MKLLQLPLLFLTVLLVAGCVTSKETQRNAELVRRYFEGWANRCDPVVADQLIATNLVLRNPPNTLHSLEEYKKTMSAFHKAFPDLHYTVEDLISQGDKVVVRWTMRGTQSGEYQGHQPNGKQAVITGTSTFRISGAKIQEVWVNMDRFGLMQQLGWLTSAPERK